VVWNLSPAVVGSWPHRGKGRKVFQKTLVQDFGLTSYFLCNRNEFFGCGDLLLDELGTGKDCVLHNPKHFYFLRYLRLRCTLNLFQKIVQALWPILAHESWPVYLLHNRDLVITFVALIIHWVPIFWSNFRIKSGLDLVLLLQRCCRTFSERIHNLLL